MTYRLVTIGAYLVLAGCVTSNGAVQEAKFPIEIQTTEKETILVNHGSGYTLKLPTELHIYGSKRFFSTIPPPSTGKFPIYEQQLSHSDYDVRIYHSSPSPHCESIGVTSPQEEEQEGVRVRKGKVDYPPDYELTPLTPDCRAYKPYAASYILCSERADVQVAICIHQVTDDPALAEGVFDTFQWLD